MAADKGHEDVAALLVANKAEIDAKDEGGQTPLHGASAEGHREVVELLLASHAEVIPQKTSRAAAN
jgi:ankyrin repeat protein